ncbi:MAG: hypothetical protein ACFFCS_13415 [Candidatus Hodarchaeota archaeon]
MGFAEFVYVEFTLVGPLPEIFKKIEGWLVQNSFTIKTTQQDKEINAEFSHEELARKMQITFAKTEKGTLISVNNEFINAKLSGKIDTLRIDINNLVDAMDLEYEIVK